MIIVDAKVQALVPLWEIESDDDIPKEISLGILVKASLGANCNVLCEYSSSGTCEKALLRSSSVRF